MRRRRVARLAYKLATAHCSARILPHMINSDTTTIHRDRHRTVDSDLSWADFQTCHSNSSYSVPHHMRFVACAHLHLYTLFPGIHAMHNISIPGSAPPPPPLSPPPPPSLFHTCPHTFPPYATIPSPPVHTPCHTCTSTNTPFPTHCSKKRKKALLHKLLCIASLPLPHAPHLHYVHALPLPPPHLAHCPTCTYHCLRLGMPSRAVSILLCNQQPPLWHEPSPALLHSAYLYHCLARLFLLPSALGHVASFWLSNLRAAAPCAHFARQRTENINSRIHKHEPRWFMGWTKPSAAAPSLLADRCWQGRLWLLPSTGQQLACGSAPGGSYSIIDISGCAYRYAASQHARERQAWCSAGGPLDILDVASAGLMARRLQRRYMPYTPLSVVKVQHSGWQFHLTAPLPPTLP